VPVGRTAEDQPTVTTRWWAVGCAALLAAGFLLTFAAPARADEEEKKVTPAQGIAELDAARSQLDEGVRLYGQGEVDAAYEAARNAYLEHFELIEVPLRVRDEALTLQLEEDFANVRSLIEAGASVGEVKSAAAEVRAGLTDVERALSSPGLAAPLLAAGYAFIILFREGLEAVLVVAAILGYLEASRNLHYRGPILRGVGAAVAATIVTFVLATVVAEIAPLQRELIEGVTAIAAVLVLFYVSFWLVARLDQRRWMEFVKAKVWGAAATGSAFALAAVGFTAVYREGFETALFYQALIGFARDLGEWVALGAAAGAVVLVGVGWVVFRAGRRLPIKVFLTTAVVLVMTMSVAFAGNAVRALQEAAVIPVTFVESLPRLPIFLADMTGWHPTVQTFAAQAALIVIYVCGAVWTFAVLPRRERRPQPAAQPGGHDAEETARG
jgi:high-affinity iron transporter